MATATVAFPVTGTRTAARAENLTRIYGSGDTAVRALYAVSADFAAGSFPTPA